MESFDNAATGQSKDGYLVTGEFARTGNVINNVFGTGFTLSMPDAFTVRVTLTRAMPSANINVQLTYARVSGGEVTNLTPTRNTIDASHFDVQFLKSNGTLLDLSGDSVQVCFVARPQQ